MSLRENIQIFHQLDIENYLKLLQREYMAREHPIQTDCYLIDDPELPFYEPKQTDEYSFIIGFNYAPLSSLLIQVLIDHPNLIHPDTLVRWTSEQELLLENSIEELKRLG